MVIDNKKLLAAYPVYYRDLKIQLVENSLATSQEDHLRTAGFLSTRGIPKTLLQKYTL